VISKKSEQQRRQLVESIENSLVSTSNTVSGIKEYLEFKFVPVVLV
jgi:hypothetical protein